jgi:1-acyl-sn-glycerol-3-phosphate acyltransferase
VIPCYIDGAYEAWGRHRKWPRLFGRVSCVFGSPILAETFSHLEKKEAQAQISAAIEAAILKLKEWLKNGAEGIPP